ncbi:MAG: hypothetical protein JWR69_4622 [Pedosphaera sp.]|nr:hypothetical protein [Pedosphaera sp.]
MPMQESTAKAIWLAAIKDVTGTDPVNPVKKWTEYMSNAQLEAAYDETNAALAANQWSCSWRLLELAQCATVKDQYLVLAAKSTRKSDASSAVRLAVAKATKPLIGK